MNRIKFNEGGQPVFLDDFKLLQDNQQCFSEELIRALCGDTDVIISGATLDYRDIEGRDDAITVIVKEGKAFIGGEFVEWTSPMEIEYVYDNYKNLPKEIHSTYDYLELFFRNLILAERNVLSNRSMLVLEPQSANNEISKCQNGSLDCSLDEFAVLRYLKENPDAKQTDIAKHIGKSERTIKRITPSLIERGLLERENGKRNGRWVVKCDI